MARLKVFGAQLGFQEAVVAVPSQKAALAAWGTHQNLFASGAAREIEDPELKARALAEPGVVLQRPLGGGALISAAPAGESKPAAAPRPDLKARRRALETAQGALEKAATTFSRRLADLDHELERLQAARAALEAERQGVLEALGRKVEAAQAALEA